jgi:hypothetical protein
MPEKFPFITKLNKALRSEIRCVKTTFLIEELKEWKEADGIYRILAMRISY